MVKIKDIEGALKKKKEISEWEDMGARGRIYGFNNAIDQIGEREIGLNREKLIVAIGKSLFNNYFHLMEPEQAKNSKDTCKTIADAIIAQEKEILEVRK